MRFELTTSTLARWRSTPELHPHLAPKAHNTLGGGYGKQTKILQATKSIFTESFVAICQKLPF